MTLWALNTFVNVAKGSLGIHLSIPSGILHGLLVTPEQWYQEWFEGIAAAGEGGVLAHRMLTNVLAVTGHMTPEGAIVDHGETYLHIKDGRLISGGEPHGPMLWKVRISSVSAWSLGRSNPDA